MSEEILYTNSIYIIEGRELHLKYSTLSLLPIV